MLLLHQISPITVVVPTEKDHCMFFFSDLGECRVLDMHSSASNCHLNCPGGIICLCLVAQGCDLYVHGVNQFYSIHGGTWG